MQPHGDEGALAATGGFGWPRLTDTEPCSITILRYSSKDSRCFGMPRRMIRHSRDVPELCMAMFPDIPLGQRRIDFAGM